MWSTDSVILEQMQINLPCSEDSLNDSVLEHGENSKADTH